MRIVPLPDSRPAGGAPAPALGAAAAVRGGGAWRPRVALLRAALAGFAALLAVWPAQAAMTGGCDTAEVVSHALPSVVNISVVRVLPTKSADGTTTGQHFELFVGSGSIIDPSGIIVTNKHVIQDGAMIRVTLQDKSQLRAQLVAAAALVDLALLKVTSADPLPTLSFANSDSVRIGQPVIAVGNPLGVGTSVSTGVVSAVNRDLMRTPFDDFIQTDASLNPGNSGGPLLDCSGKIVGVNTALLSNNSLLGSIGLGFALPSNDAAFVANLLRHPDMEAPNWVGVHLQDLTEQLAMVFHRPSTGGAIVSGIDPGSPAAQTSLATGDIVTAVAGEPMSDSRAILRALVALPSGNKISLTVWRHRQMQEVTIQGKPWPHMMALRSEVLASAENITLAESGGLGLHVASITPADRQRYKLQDASGVLIDQIKPGSQAEHLNLEAGDVIEQVGDRPATTPDQVAAMLTRGRGERGDLVAMLVRDQKGARWNTLWIGKIDPNDRLADQIPPPPQAGGPVQDVVAHPQ